MDQKGTEQQKDSEELDKPFQNALKIGDISIAVRAVEQLSVDQLALEQAFRDYSNAITDAVTTKKGAIKSTPIKQLKGNVAEAHLVESCNIDARSLKIPKEAFKARLAKPGDPFADVHLDTVKGGKSYQAKFYDTPAKTAEALSHLDNGFPKYTEGKVAPKDQIKGQKGIESYSGRKAVREADKRPMVAAAHRHTSQNVQDNVSHPEYPARGDGLTNREAEQMTMRAKRGETVEYRDADKKREQLLNISVKDAARSGFVSGCITSGIGELVTMCKKGKSYSRDDFAQAVVNVVVSGIDSGARATVTAAAERLLLINMRESLAVNGGVSLVRMQGAAIAANVLYDFGKMLFQFSLGRLDTDELIANTLSSALQTTGVAIGSAAGSSLASAIGLGATIGTPLGPLGIVLGSALGGLVMGLGVNLVVNSAQQEGLLRFQRDLDAFNQQVGQGASVYKYIDVIGELADYRFSLKHLVPCYGLFGTLAEYNARKKALKSLATDLQARKASVRQQEQAGMEAIERQYFAACRKLELEFNIERAQLAHKADEHVQDLHGQMRAYLTERRMIMNVQAEPQLAELMAQQEVLESVRLRRRDMVEVSQAIEELKVAAALISDPADRQAIRRALDLTIRGWMRAFDAPAVRARQFLQKASYGA